MASTTSRGPAAALSLYRSILRAHGKYLPPEMKSLGDAYVKSEFRLHKSATKPEHINQFFDAWQDYLQQLLSTARAKETIATGVLDSPDASSQQQKQSFDFGRDLPPDAELNDEQKAQLTKLKEEASKAGRPGSS